MIERKDKIEYLEIRVIEECARTTQSIVDSMYWGIKKEKLGTPGKDHLQDILIRIDNLRSQCSRYEEALRKEFENGRLGI